MKKVLKLVADFETTTIENDCRVWASCLYSIDDKQIVHLSNNIDEFMQVLRINSLKNSLEIYFHNLKFDGEFILSWLYNNGFKYDDLLSSEKTFKTLITDMGLFYQLEVRFGKVKRSKIVVIRDSLKIIPLKVSEMAKAFGLKTLKGEIDYKVFRPVGHKLTSEEIEYIKNDVIIVGESLSVLFDLGLNKMTAASNALQNYKDSIGGKLKFRNLFPVIPKVDDDFIRKAYRGGYTYVHPKIASKALKCNGMTFDVNSLYPSRMYYEELPYDMPIYYKGKYQPNATHPLYIQRLKCKFKLKKGYVPIIQMKNNARFLSTEYLKNSGIERVELTVTSVDLELIKKHYTLTNVTYLDGYMFKGKIGLFQNYIDYWIEVKNQATKDGNKGLRQIAKLMLNSLYGKFATNGVSDVKIPIIDGGVVKHQTKCTIDVENFDGVLKEDKERELNYTAMACFITAYARKVTIEAIQDVGGLNKDSRFCYCDTDSIHIIGEEVPNIWVDDVELGAWKHESNWTFAKFIRAKTYIEDIIFKKVINKDGEIEYKESLDFNIIDKKKLDVKCAGMPDNVKELITKDNFKIGFSVLANDKTIDSKYKKLMPKRVPGGIVLKETDFTIK